MKKKWNEYIFKLSIKRFWKEHLTNVLLSFFIVIFIVISGLFVSMNEPIAKDQKYNEVLNYNKRLEANINYDEIGKLNLNELVAVPGFYIDNEDSDKFKTSIILEKEEVVVIKVMCDSLSIYYGNNNHQKCQLLTYNTQEFNDNFYIKSNMFHLEKKDIEVIFNPYVKKPTLLLTDDLYKKVDLYRTVYSQVSNLISSPNNLVFKEEIEEGKFYYPSTNNLTVFIKGKRFDLTKTSSNFSDNKMIINPNSFKDAQTEFVSMRFSCFQDLLRAEKILKKNNIAYNVHYKEHLTKVIQIPKSVTLIISIIGVLLFSTLIFILVNHSKEKKVYKNLKINKKLYKNNELAENVLFGVINILFASIALVVSIFSFKLGTLFPVLPLYIYPVVYGYIIILSTLKYFYGVSRYED